MLLLIAALIIVPVQTYYTWNCGFYYILGAFLQIKGVKTFVFGPYFKAGITSPSLFIFSTISVPYIFLGYVMENLLEIAWLPLKESIILSWNEFQLNDTGKSRFVFIVAYFLILNPLLIFMYSHSKFSQKSDNK